MSILRPEIDDIETWPIEHHQLWIIFCKRKTSVRRLRFCCRHSAFGIDNLPIVHSCKTISIPTTSLVCSVGYPKILALGLLNQFSITFYNVHIFNQCQLSWNFCHHTVSRCVCVRESQRACRACCVYIFSSSLVNRSSTSFGLNIFSSPQIGVSAHDSTRWFINCNCNSISK